jgi:hypothetical protein
LGKRPVEVLDFAV